MSKYTTEVRYICEHYAGLDESATWVDVDDILERSYDKIFDVEDIPIFDTTYRAGLFKKILLHYYTREIGYETVGLWKMKLNQKMREIMPYYNQLYESTLLTYDPLKNVQNTHEHHGDFNEDGNDHYTDRDTGTQRIAGSDTTMLRHKENTNAGTTENSMLTDGQHAGDQWTTFSDTPQGALTGVENEDYLTNATHNKGTTPYVDTKTEQTSDGTLEYNKGNKNDKANYADTTDTDKTRHDDLTHEHTKDKDHREGKDNYTNTEMGKIGTETYQEMVMKYRETFLNIDMMIIKDLGDLFMKVW